MQVARFEHRLQRAVARSEGPAEEPPKQEERGCDWLRKRVASGGVPCSVLKGQAKLP